MIHDRAAPTRAALGSRAAVFVLAAVGLGALAGVAWWLVVDLPPYALDAQGRASTTERALAQFFAGDAWFCVLGVGVGVLLGWAGWWLFRRAGWIVVPVVAVAASLAGLCCWLVGYQLGPGEFTHLIATAPPGSLVPISLTVRSKAALLVWPFAAVLVVLLAASLARDDEEPRPAGTERRRAAGRQPTSADVS